MSVAAAAGSSAAPPRRRSGCAGARGVLPSGPPGVLRTRDGDHMRAGDRRHRRFLPGHAYSFSSTTSKQEDEHDEGTARRACAAGPPGLVQAAPGVGEAHGGGLGGPAGAVDGKAAPADGRSGSGAGRRRRLARAAQLAGVGRQKREAQRQSSGFLLDERRLATSVPAETAGAGVSRGAPDVEGASVPTGTGPIQPLQGRRVRLRQAPPARCGAVPARGLGSPGRAGGQSACFL